VCRQTTREPACNGACPCPRDGRDVIAHAKWLFCPAWLFGTGVAPEGWDALPQVKAGEAPTPEPPPDLTPLYHALWAELHAAGKAATSVASFARYVREDFTPRIPCGPCQARWRGLLERMPPEQAADPFAWTVDAHNAVNVELGKPEVSIEEAPAALKETMTRP
jgi:hypothetical protein